MMDPVFILFLLLMMVVQSLLFYEPVLAVDMTASNWIKAYGSSASVNSVGSYQDLTPPTQPSIDLHPGARDAACVWIVDDRLYVFGGFTYGDGMS